MFEAPLTLEWDGSVLRACGNVDEYALTEFRERIGELAETGEMLAVDVSEVGFLPSAGIGVLARAHSRALAAGVEIYIVATPESPARRLLEITGVPFVSQVPNGRHPSD